MGSVQDWVKCPKCKEFAYSRDYYYKTSEEYCTCVNCGFTRNITLKRDKDNNLVRKMEKRYDLRNECIVYGEAMMDKNDNIKLLHSQPVLPTDTEENFMDFINLHLCFPPFSEKEPAEKFKGFGKTVRDSWFNVFLKKEDGSYEQLWYLMYKIIINDEWLEVYKVQYDTKTYGGFGVVTVKRNNGLMATRILEEGEVPEITDDVVFASAVIDGKLQILKEPEREPEETE